MRAAPALPAQQRTRACVCAQAHLGQDDGRLALLRGELLRDLVQRLGHELEHEVEEGLLLVALLAAAAALFTAAAAAAAAGSRHARIARRVKVLLERDDIGVAELAHHLQLAVAEAAVLQHALDGHALARLDDARLVDDAEGAAAHHRIARHGQRAARRERAAAAGGSVGGRGDVHQPLARRGGRCGRGGAARHGSSRAAGSAGGGRGARGETAGRGRAAAECISREL